MNWWVDCIYRSPMMELTVLGIVLVPASCWLAVNMGERYRRRLRALKLERIRERLLS